MSEELPWHLWCVSLCRLDDVYLLQTHASTAVSHVTNPNPFCGWAWFMATCAPPPYSNALVASDGLVLVLICPFGMSSQSVSSLSSTTRSFLLSETASSSTSRLPYSFSMASWVSWSVVPFCGMNLQSLHEENLPPIESPSRVSSLYELRLWLVTRCGADHFGSSFHSALNV
jgi:hypothetical protein